MIIALRKASCLRARRYARTSALTEVLSAIVSVAVRYEYSESLLQSFFGRSNTPSEVSAGGWTQLCYVKIEVENRNGRWKLEGTIPENLKGDGEEASNASNELL